MNKRAILKRLTLMKGNEVLLDRAMDLAVELDLAAAWGASDEAGWELRRVQVAELRDALDKLCQDMGELKGLLVDDELELKGVGAKRRRVKK